MPRRGAVSPTTATLSDRVFSELVQKARQRGGRIYPLHVGDTYLDPLPAARAEAQRTADHDRLHNYAPVQGEPTFLAAIVARMRGRGAEVSPDDVQVMAGATAGLACVAATLLDPGDEVLIPAPFWPLIRGIVASRGAVPVELPLFDRLADPAFDPEAAFERAVTPRTAALYINTPHNPTGGVLPDAVVDALLRVAVRHDLWVISDEAYEEIWFDDVPPRPVFARPEVAGRTVAVHTLSKGYGLAGARTGWAHGPPAAMTALRSVQTFTTYCAPRPMQLGAARALAEGDAWLAESRRLYAEAGRAAAAVLGVAPPRGGTFLFFDASPYLAPDDATALPFLERCLSAGVLLTPGSACGRDYARWVRLCFTSVPLPELRAALELLAPLLR